MKQILVFLTAVLLLSVKSDAQSATDSVKAVINQLFVGMKNADSGLIRSAFSDNAILQTISVSKDGVVKVIDEEVSEFAKSIKQIPKGAADEQITFETIKIDGPLAIAWTPYKFYYNGKFSHCGVNSFQLVKQNNEWKIQYIIDTRRRQGCE